MVLLTCALAGGVLVQRLLTEAGTSRELGIPALQPTSPPVVISAPPRARRARRIPTPIASRGRPQHTHAAPRKTIARRVGEPHPVAPAHPATRARTTPRPHTPTHSKPSQSPPPTTTTTTAAAAPIPLAAGTTSCSGTFSGNGKDVIVPAGAVCVLTAGTTVTHDLTVAPGGTLIDPAVTIGHDLVAQNAAGIAISGDLIGHDLRIEGLSGSATAAGNYVCDTTVRHDLTVEGGLSSAGALVVGGCPEGGNTVGHDLVVAGNANAVTVAGNAAGHDLRVDGAVAGAGNSAGHDLQVPGASAGGSAPSRPSRPSKH